MTIVLFSRTFYEAQSIGKTHFIPDIVIYNNFVLFYMTCLHHIGSIYLSSCVLGLGLWCLTPLLTTFQSVLLVEETGENHRPAASHWQTLSHNSSGDRH